MIRALSEQASVSQWPLRILLTVLTLAVIVLALLALRAGWRRRGRRQAWPDPPATPHEGDWAADPARSVTGKYIGTVTAGDWNDRIIAGGGMARTVVTRSRDGLQLDRQGEPPLWIPGETITDVTTSPGLLQKVFGRHGVLLVTWTWGGRAVSSGIWFPAAADQSTVRGWAESFLVAPTGDQGGAA